MKRAYLTSEVRYISTMPRRELFEIGDIIHVYNRGVDRRVTFVDSYDYVRFIDLLGFCNLYDYPYSSYRKRLEQVKNSGSQSQVVIQKTLDRFHRYDKPLVGVVAFTLMPNHYHLILVENQERGISQFLSQVINAYTKYFNIKSERTGNLFSGAYKHVKVKSGEQLFYLSRYVHINPVAAGLVEVFDLGSYPWSSLPEYLVTSEGSEGGVAANICEAKGLVMDNFKDGRAYFNFVTADLRKDEAASELEGLTLDDDLGWYEGRI